MKIIESHQVPAGNVSPDIFALPCINWAIKNDEFGIIYQLDDSVAVGRCHAIPTNWICKDINGRWDVMTDEQYKQFTKRE